MDKHREELTGECQFSVPQYNFSLSICIPNMNIFTLMVLAIPLTNKCYGITEGWTDRRTDGGKEGQM